LATAAEGGLEPAPVNRFRGAYPHQSSSCALLSRSSFRARGTCKSRYRKLAVKPGSGRLGFGNDKLSTALSLQYSPGY